MSEAFPTLLSAALTVFIALIFVRSAWHKIADFTEFTGFVADYNLLNEQMVRPVSMLLVVSEIGLVGLSVVPGAHGFALTIAAGLLSAYAIAMAINIRRGRTSIECGCGGAVQPLSASLVVRNLLLAGLALLSAVQSPWGLDVAAAAGALCCGFLLWAGFLLVDQLLANFSVAKLTR